MMGDQPRQLQELAKAAAAFELASDERQAEVQQQMVTLRATKQQKEIERQGTAKKEKQEGMESFAAQ